MQAGLFECSQEARTSHSLSSLWLPNLFTSGHTWKITFVQHTGANLSGCLLPEGVFVPRANLVGIVAQGTFYIISVPLGLSQTSV